MIRAIITLLCGIGGLTICAVGSCIRRAKVQFIGIFLVVVAVLLITCD